MTSDWSKPTRYIVAVGLVLLGCYILYLARSVIPLLVIAALIAAISRPFINSLQRDAHLPRGVAVALVYIGILIIVPLILLLAIPAVIDAVEYVLSLDYQSITRGVIDWLRTSLTNIQDMNLPFPALEPFVDETVATLLAGLNAGEVEQTPIETPSVATILQSIGSALTATFVTAAGVVGSVFTRAALVLFVFLSSLYISLSAHTFQDAFLNLVPDRFRSEISTLIARILRMWGAFFRGQLTLMLVIGIFTWIGLSILGVPGAVYLAIVAGLLELIPNLGPIIATIPAVIVALLQGSSNFAVSPFIFGLIVIGFYILLQQLENNIIVPRVLGEAVELPPLVVLTGVLVGAEVAGLLGALLATPVIATLREIVHYAYRKVLGESPYSPEEETAKQQEEAPKARPAWLEQIMTRFRKLQTRTAIPQTGRKPKRKAGAKIFTPKK